MLKAAAKLINAIALLLYAKRINNTLWGISGGGGFLKDKNGYRCWDSSTPVLIALFLH